MPETIFGRIEEFAPGELVNTAVGVLAGAFGHMLMESALDNFFKSRYPEDYWKYSTALTSAIFLGTAAVLYIYGRRPGYELLQYLAGGILLAELVQVTDMIQVSFAIRE